MNKDLKYCTYTPDFPKNAFMIISHLTHKSLPHDYFQKYPFINLVTTLEEVVKDITDLSKYAYSKGEMIVADMCTVVPVSFHSLYELHEEFWVKPTRHYDPDDRVKLLISAISQYEMYKLLVTPHIENNIETVAAAIPFYLSAENSMIKKFMMTSDWPVDEKAKYAAFYMFKQPKIFNWKTREVTDIIIQKEKCDKSRIA